jgi:hypothetical protein
VLPCHGRRSTASFKAFCRLEVARDLRFFGVSTFSPLPFFGAIQGAWGWCLCGEKPAGTATSTEILFAETFGERIFVKVILALGT